MSRVGRNRRAATKPKKVAQPATVRSSIPVTKTTLATRRAPALTTLLATITRKTSKSPITTTLMNTPVHPALPESTIVMEGHAICVRQGRPAVRNQVRVINVQLARTKMEPAQVVISVLQTHTVVTKPLVAIIALEGSTLAGRRKRTMIVQRSA